MTSSLPSWTRWFVTAAVVWHLLTLLSPSWIKASKESHGRDFASYYYALQVAADGSDPYVKANLDQAARSDRTRKQVYPYFYPPTFLLPMVWALPLDLVTAYRLWFWLDELFTLGVLLVLWRWWRPLGSSVPVVLALVIALLSSIPNNHLMGQVNIPVLAIVVFGLFISEREERWARGLGGGLLGLACMMKMSPALIVAWCLLHRRYLVVFSACAMAILLSLMTLPLLGVDLQLRFYTEVLPQFSSGNYNGLSVPIGMFGNHSVPNFVHQLFGGGPKLSAAAAVCGTLINLGIIIGLGWAFRNRPTDLLQRGAQLGAVCAVMLLVPAYTYEHHMIWLIPAATVCLVALLEGRLARAWGLPIGLAVAVWCYDLATLKQLSVYLSSISPPLSFLVQELKFGALLVLLAGSIRLSVESVATKARAQR
jgi:hypothetical protein